MSLFKKLSLRTKLIGMVVTVNILVGAGGYYSMTQMKGTIEHDMMDFFKGNADRLSAAITAQFFERYGDVQAFAQTMATVDPKFMQKDLDGYVKMYGIYDLILVVDTKGRYVTSNTFGTDGRPVNTVALKEMSFADAPWFKAAMAGQFTEDKENGYAGTFFEEMHVDPIMNAAFKETKVMTGFTAQVKDFDGNVLGVITNRATTKWIDGELLSLYDSVEASGNKDAEISILNKDGILISEFKPGERNYKKEVIYDLERILKVNMKDEHVPAAGILIEGKSGAMTSTDVIDNASDVVGYAHITGPKWIKSLGWGVMVHNDEETVMAPAIRAMQQYLIVGGLASAIAILFAIFYGLSLSRTLTGFSTVLEKNSGEVADASTKIASSATELSEASTEQAAALQETVAAVDEISAMVDKNAEAANRSKDASVQSREAALKGRQTVDQMMQAINEINNSNEEVSSQMESSNAQLAEITKLINDIGSKTKVINEIVFQTKLLSFNASVEAARAGEYGKGFAVVAEEVGNLAQMSGNAAKEITTLLEESVRKVEFIVNDSKSKVQRLIDDSRDKVRTGSETARSCNESLEEILASVSSVDTLVAEIAVASQEQATGIREISKAVGQMEQVTKQNSSVAETSSQSAEELSGQSTQLRAIIEDLAGLISGQGSKSKSSYSASSSSSPSSGGRVLKFERKASNTKQERAEESHSEPLKMASGGDSFPSSDDPGFGA